jgi:hypothetical protein
MFRRIRSTRTLFFTSIFVAGSLGWLAGHAAESSDDEKDDDRSVEELAQDQVKLADEAIRAAWEAFRASRVNLAAARVDRWSLRRVEALRETGASHKKMVDAWKLHRDQMEALSKLAKSHYKDGRATLLDYLEAQYALTEAKRELAKVRADDKNRSDKSGDDEADTRDDEPSSDEASSNKSSNDTPSGDDAQPRKARRSTR